MNPPKEKKKIPFEFVLETLERVNPRTRSMFGCTAVYVAESLVLILRKRKDHVEDNGVWVATSIEHHASFKKLFPSLRSIRLFGSVVTAWQNIPDGAADFEESVMHICRLILKGDSRIGKVPKSKPRKKSARGR